MVRIKERYLLVNIIYPPESATKTKSSVPSFVVQHQPTVENLTPQALMKAIRNEISQLFGDHGLGALSGNLSGRNHELTSCGTLLTRSVKYMSLATSTVILRCHRTHYRMLWAALTLMDHVPVKDGRPCIFRVVRVSGTIRKAEEEAIRQARALVLAAKDGTTPSAFLSTASVNEYSEDDLSDGDVQMASDDD